MEGWEGPEGSISLIWGAEGGGKSTRAEQLWRERIEGSWEAGAESGGSIDRLVLLKRDLAEAELGV